MDDPRYRAKVLRWLGGSEALYKKALSQNVISVYNKITSEETKFNPLRAKRPVAMPEVADLD